MQENRKDKKGRKTPTVAPGYHDEKFGEDASQEEIRQGKSTKVTRVYLDENDPS